MWNSNPYVLSLQEWNFDTEITWRNIQRTAEMMFLRWKARYMLSTTSLQKKKGGAHRERYQTWILRGKNWFHHSHRMEGSRFPKQVLKYHPRYESWGSGRLHLNVPASWWNMMMVVMVMIVIIKLNKSLLCFNCKQVLRTIFWV